MKVYKYLFYLGGYGLDQLGYVKLVWLSVNSYIFVHCLPMLKISGRSIMIRPGYEGLLAFVLIWGL